MEGVSEYPGRHGTHRALHPGQPEARWTTAAMLAFCDEVRRLDAALSRLTEAFRLLFRVVSAKWQAALDLSQQLDLAVVRLPQLRIPRGVGSLFLEDSASPKSARNWHFLCLWWPLKAL